MKFVIVSIVSLLLFCIRNNSVLAEKSGTQFTKLWKWLRFEFGLTYLVWITISIFVTVIKR